MNTSNTSKNPKVENKEKQLREKYKLVIENQPADHLSEHGDTINLRAMYPLAHRVIYMRSWKYVLGFVITTIGIILMNKSTLSDNVFFYQNVSFYVFFTTLLVVSIKLIYENFFHIVFYYGIEAEHFVVSSGIFLKRRSSLHISELTDVFLERNFIDLLFLLYTIRVANPSPESQHNDYIRGLGKHSAIGLQDFLTDLIRRTREGPKGLEELAN